jgi:hypothetical protein
MVTASPAPPDLQQLYSSVLAPRLAALEGERLKARFAIVAGMLLVGLPIVGFCQSDVVGLALPDTARQWTAPICFVLIFVGAIVAIAKFAVPGVTAYLNYRARFKRDIVAEIFKTVSPGAVYAPDRYISEAIFDAGGLFVTRGSFKGDDLVRGHIGRTPFEACELQREYTEGSGKDSTTRVVFHGLFFHLDFNKVVHGRTIVQPAGAPGWRLGLRRDLARVALEDPEFEQQFEAFSTNQVEARYILTPLLMQRIVEIGRKTGKPIFLGFAGSSAYVGVDYGRALFEPSIATSTSFESLVEMADHFRLAELIVQELDLNTRIWTKDVDGSLLETAPTVGPLESVATGDLDAANVWSRAMQMAGKIYEDVNTRSRPEPPARTRARLDRDGGGLTVRYRLAWWFFPCLVIAAAAALVALAAVADLASADVTRQAIAFVTPERSIELEDLVRRGGLVALIVAVAVGAIPALCVVGYVRRVHIGRDEVRVWRGLRPFPRRYPLTDRSRILQLDNFVLLGHANEFKLVNVALAPTLSTTLEARWIAWEMRLALAETKSAT